MLQIVTIPATRFCTCKKSALVAKNGSRQLVKVWLAANHDCRSCKRTCGSCGRNNQRNISSPGLVQNRICITAVGLVAWKLLSHCWCRESGENGSTFQNNRTETSTPRSMSPVFRGAHPQLGVCEPLQTYFQAIFHFQALWRTSFEEWDPFVSMSLPLQLTTLFRKISCAGRPTAS